MTPENRTSEPSMDEILASIRQIMSNDSKGQKDDILDLVHVLPEEKPFVARETEKSFLSNENKTKRPVVQKEHRSHSHLIEAQRKRSLEIKLDELLVSPATVSQTANAFHSLNQLPQEKKPLPKVPLPQGMGGHPIESQLHEILKPLLKEWLDANLPLLVRWVVTEQVEKILRQGKET